jgi:BASS family bile acid:Na+ symporter
LALNISVGLAAFSLGLNASLRKALFLFRKPDDLGSALISMYAAMPAVAVAAALLFDLPPVVKIALVAYSISPIPPVLPAKAIRAGGDDSYAVGLLMAGSLLSIILVPLALELFQVIFDVPLQMTPAMVAAIMLKTILAPFAAGIAVRFVMPWFAARAAGPVATSSTALLVIALIPILVSKSEELLSLMGGGTLAALAIFAGVGVVVGHALGGPDNGDRTVLALYTSARHPGVAVAIAQTNFPDQPFVLSAVLLAVVVSALVALPYVTWAKHHKTSGGVPSATKR